MRLEISSNLPCGLQQARAAVKTLGLLNYVAAPIMKFESVELFDEHKALEARPYVMNMKLFGMLPLGLHTMDFSYHDTHNSFLMRDNGSSRLCKKWDHKMRFKEAEEGVNYSDSADIGAGVLTPIVWLFALCFYKHRQRRWKRIANNEFKALSVDS